MEDIRDIKKFGFPDKIYIYGENVLSRLNTRDSVSQDFTGRRADSWAEHLTAGVFGFQPCEYSYVIRRNRRAFQLRGPKVIEVCQNGMVWGCYMSFDQFYGHVKVFDVSLRERVESIVEELNQLGGINFKSMYSSQDSRALNNMQTANC